MIEVFQTIEFAFNKMFDMLQTTIIYNGISVMSLIIAIITASILVSFVVKMKQ